MAAIILKFKLWPGKYTNEVHLTKHSKVLRKLNIRNESRHIEHCPENYACGWNPVGSMAWNKLHNLVTKLVRKWSRSFPSTKINSHRNNFPCETGKHASICIQTYTQCYTYKDGFCIAPASVETWQKERELETETSGTVFVVSFSNSRLASAARQNP